MAGNDQRLLGRSDEFKALDGVIEAARTGRSQVLVLRGEAGVGKTALLDYAAERAAGFRTAQATVSRPQHASERMRASCRPTCPTWSR